MGIIRTRSAEKTNTMMRSFAVIATVASIAALSSASTLTEKRQDGRLLRLRNGQPRGIIRQGMRPGTCVQPRRTMLCGRESRQLGKQLSRWRARHLQGRRVDRVPELRLG